MLTSVASQQQINSGCSSNSELSPDLRAVTSYSPPEEVRKTAQTPTPMGDAASTAEGMPARHYIAADNLKLALIARLHDMGTGGTRWAAMAEGWFSPLGCTAFRGTTPLRLHRPSQLSPMDRGHIGRVIDRVRSQGRREVLATFGCGIRALKASAPSCILRVGQ